MVWRYTEWHYGGLDIMWRWAQYERLLNQTQKDPLGLGFNTSSTGWHCIAAVVGLISPGLVGDGVPSNHNIIKDLSQAVIRDRCVCWCISRGDGCSALQSLWKAKADWREWNANHNDVNLDYDRHGARRHCLLHHHQAAEHSTIGQSSNGNPIFTMAVDLVRLLTFEALDMTHTCCYLEEIESLRVKRPRSPAQRKEQSVEWDNGRFLCRPHAIANCNPEVVDEIRSDSMEQQNARLLDELMHEFEPQLLDLDFSNRKALHQFVWGPWRRRISPLFAVDDQIVSEMEEAVYGVTVTCKQKTH
jgi:hypothetical protein